MSLGRILSRILRIHRPIAGDAVAPAAWQLGMAKRRLGRRVVLDGVTYWPHDHRPVGGDMAQWVGARYGSVVLASSDWAEAKAIPLIRAFRVPSLEGATFRANNEADLASSLDVVLAECFPGHPWSSIGFEGPLRKYGALRTDVVAPPDSVTGHPMSLELFGYVTVFGGRPVDGQSLRDLRPGPADVRMTTPLDGPLEVRIEIATYANVTSTGVGVPLYS